MENLERFELLKCIYNEHANQARQHENQRSNMTNLMLAITTITISIISLSKQDFFTMVFALFLIFLGLFGAEFSKKHYERNRFHTKIMKAIRNEMDKMLIGESKNNSIESIIRDAKNDHYTKYPEKSIIPDNAAKIPKKRLYMYWQNIHYIVSVIGIILFIITVVLYPRETQPLKVIIIDPRNI